MNSFRGMQWNSRNVILDSSFSILAVHQVHGFAKSQTRLSDFHFLFTTSTTWEASVGLGMKKFHSLSCFSPHAKRKLNVEEKFWILSLMETVALSQYTDVRCFCCVWPVFMAINYVGWSTESQVQRRKWLVVFGEKESAIHFSLFFSPEIFREDV